MITLDQWVKLLQQQKKVIRTQHDRALRIAAVTTNGLMHKRIFTWGRNNRGGLIGHYSTRPTLSSGTTAKSKTIWRTLAGSKSKRRNLDWVTIRSGGNLHRLFVIQGGYKEIRKLENLPSAYVDLNFTGELQKDFHKPPRKFGHKMIKTLRPANNDKMVWNEDRFSTKIMGATRQEEKTFADVFQFELTKRETL